MMPGNGEIQGIFVECHCISFGGPCSFLPMVCLTLLMFWSHESAFKDSVADQMSKLFLVQAFAFCLVLSTGFWHGRTGSKRNVFSLSLTLCIHVIMECGYGDLVWCLCINRISFWCELNTLTTVLPCLSPGCSCYGDSSQGGGIPFVPHNQCTLCHPCAVKSFLPVFFLVFWDGKDLQEN